MSRRPLDRVAEGSRDHLNRGRIPSYIINPRARGGSGAASRADSSLAQLWEGPGRARNSQYPSSSSLSRRRPSAREQSGPLSRPGMITRSLLGGPQEGFSSSRDSATGRTWPSRLSRQSPMNGPNREGGPRSEMLSMTSRTEQGDRRAGSLLGRPREGLCSRLDDTTARTKASGLGRTNPTSGLNKEPRSEMMSMTDRTPQDDRGASSSSRQPNKNGSMLITQHDREMASRQTRIDSLPPDQRKEQETWAQKQLKGLSAMCPYGCQWKRSKTYGGYLCAAKLCLVTDELLAEGKGGWYTLHYGPEGLSNKNPKRQGPHYSK